MQIKEYVSKYDPENQFNVLIDSYKQIEFAWANKCDLTKLSGSIFGSIIVTGLGGSAISGDLVQNYLKDEMRIPYSVNRNYSLPSFANENTLLIASSYSGNTEETISVLNEAIKRKCKIVAITTGGQVGQIAKDNSIPVVNLQKGFQPRYSLGLSFFSLLKVLHQLGIIKDQTNFVTNIISNWKVKGVEYSKDENFALSVASELVGFIPIIYSAADITSAAGYRFKSQINENSKLHAFHHSIPEYNHNEIIGWETQAEKQFHVKVLNLIDKDYHPQIKKRFEITSELIRRTNTEIINIESTEDVFKVRLMEMVYLCDWISYYLGVLRGKDPSEIENINILKNRLA
jgi:glucose/mannose-6-phosphate isomerase